MTFASIRRFRFIAAGIVLWALSVPAQADIDGWKQERDAYRFWATSTTDPRLRVELFSHGGIPALEAFEPVSERPGLWRLRYYAGTAGTSFMVSFRRVAIIDVEAGRVLGDGLLTIEPQDGADWDQPIWEWEDRFVIVQEPDWGETLIQTEGPWFEDHAVERAQLEKAVPVKID